MRAELDSAKDAKDLKVVGGNIIEALREVHEDGSETFIGAIGFSRCPLMELAGPKGVKTQDKDKLFKENNAREVGDPDIIWTVGCESDPFLCPLPNNSSPSDYISPTHFGKGIVTDALDTLMNEWAIPRMGVRKVLGTAFVGNIGSARVFEKNGFKHRETIENLKEVKGIVRGLKVFEWRKDDN